MQSTTTSAMSSINSAVSNGMSQAVSAVQDAMQQSVSAMNSAAGQARDAGYQMGAGFLGGLNAMSGAIIGRARAIASAAAAAMRSALRIHSPSRVTRSIGNYTGEGFVIGLDKMVKPVQNIATRLAEAAVPDITPGSISSELSRLTSGNMSAGYTFKGGELSVNQPVIENTLILGGRKYDAFVEDITYRQASLEGMERY